MEKKTLGLRLLELRQSHNLTQKQLCSDLNIGRSTYSYFETGNRLPDIETLILFAQYYHVSLDELVGLSQCETGKTTPQQSADDTSISVKFLHHLRSKRIPPEFLLDLTKADYDFFKEYKCLSEDNKAELQYLTHYKVKKQKKPAD